MNDSTDNHSCPCGSGLRYTQCCGIPERLAINADLMALIGADGSVMQGELTEPVQNAVRTAHTSPDLFPARIRFFEDEAYFVKMSPQWYRESVFLDPARIKGTYVIKSSLQWPQNVTEQITPQPTGFIFHTAFCGSTLMAQALDALYDCLPLREPEVLGSLLFYLRSAKVDAPQKSHWLERVVRLLSRSYSPLQYVVVKANDNATPLMLDLLTWRNDLPVLFMYTPLSEFLAGCLRADNRRVWIRNRYDTIKTLTPSVLNTEKTINVEEDAFGEMAAVYWAYNIALYHHARQNTTEQLRSLDFNRMLEQPLRAIVTCGELFGLHERKDIDRDGEIEKLFGVYSKNSNFKYSPQQRDADIQHILNNNTEHLNAAETLAKELLGGNYPHDHLPGALLK